MHRYVEISAGPGPGQFLVFRFPLSNDIEEENQKFWLYMPEPGERAKVRVWFLLKPNLVRRQEPYPGLNEKAEKFMIEGTIVKTGVLDGRNSIYPSKLLGKQATLFYSPSIGKGILELREEQPPTVTDEYGDTAINPS